MLTSAVWTSGMACCRSSGYIGFGSISRTYYRRSLPLSAIRSISTSKCLFLKKKQDEGNSAFLGRLSNNLKIGVVGLPNIGKSTFFNALTGSSVAAENYPFCTIDPEEARVAVPDERFDTLCEMYKPKSKIPAYLTVIDIAGLVKGASSGAGLGNSFLSHIASVDAIFHVVRAFKDTGITHVEGKIDPVNDIELIHEELRLKDISYLKKFIEKNWSAVARLGKDPVGADNQAIRHEYDTLKEVMEWIGDGNDVRNGNWTDKEITVLNKHQLITAKPVIYLVNLSEDDYINKGKDIIPDIEKWIEKNNADDLIIPFSGAVESLISVMDESEKAEYEKDIGVGSALPEIIVAGYKTLGLVNYFTAGSDEVRSWTIRRGTKAPQAAGIIHTDFEKGFIMAEVMTFDDLKKYGSESGVKAAGNYKQKGRDSEIEDGDIVVFKFNVTKKKATL
ncbi:hypothetical protein H4219_000932 [Mycoemilia scoparia]|uniref:Obg-like ATPase 1 n=1 Tax=Mycoemilia scoparia TaxID=417184 RepID=A0A9W8DWS3_9FUNG|nr:hypothetical protein H4219_000932 [Mycoemilia scoparia]